VLAHLWQALAVVPVVAVAVAWAPAVRGVPRSLRGVRRRSVVAWLVAVLTVLAVAAVPMLRVIGEGEAIAAMPAHVPPGPWRVLTLGLVCAALLAAKAGAVPVRLLLGTAVGLIGATIALLVLAGGGFDLTQYYPQKGLWFLALVLAPVLTLALTSTAIVVVRPVWRVAGRIPHGFVLRWSLVALASVVVLAGWLPWRIGFGIPAVETLQIADGHSFTHPNKSAQRLAIASHYGPAYHRRTVVPYVVGASAVLDPRGTQIVSSLLSFQTGQPAIGGDPPSACEAIRIVAGDDPAVVISKLPRDRVIANMRRNGCAGRAHVVQVPGGIRDVQAWHS
jgi:hypothetical protein